MTYAYRTTLIGNTSSPTGELINTNTIIGRSLGKGDAADSTETTGTASNGQYCGWHLITNYDRNVPIMYLTIPSRIKRGSRVIACSLFVYVNGSTFNGNVVPSSNSEVELWPIRRTLSSSFTGLTNTNYTTGLAWDQRGIYFGVGNDTDATFLDSFEWTQDDHDAAPSATASVIKELDIHGEMQRLLDFDEPLQVAFRAKWANDSHNEYILIDQPADSTQKNRPHSYIQLKYRLPLEVYGESGGVYNPADLKDVNSSGIDQHLYLGVIPRGASSAAEPYYVRSEITSSQPAVVLQSGATQISSIDNSLVAGSGWLRYVTGYNTTGSYQTPSGTWRLVFTAATTYDVKFTPDGSTSETTVTTGKSTASDESITYNALTAITLPILAWNGTFAAADVVSFETRGDLHSASVPLANLDYVDVAPHADGDRTTAYTSKARNLGLATTQQLCGLDTSTIANSGGETGVIATVTDGANSGTHVKVPDSSKFVADQYCTLATYNAVDETGGGGRVEQVQVKTVYSISHGTYPGQILFYETLTSPSDFDENSILTSGVWLGTLSAPDQGFLTATASISSNVISVSPTPTRTSGTIKLFDPASGTSENRVIDSVAGNDITLTAAPSYAYPTDSLYYFPDETDSNVPFFVTAAPTTGISRGRKQGYCSVVSFAIT